MAGSNPHTEAMRENIGDILKECIGIPGLESFTSKPHEVTIEEDPLFLTGFSSVIVRVRAGDGSTVIAKHAPSYVRKFCENSPPLSPIRTELEMTGLQLFEKYCPGCSPKPFFYSSKHNTGLVEDLIGFKTQHSELLAGNVSKSAMGAIAVHMARLHRSTLKDNISAEEWAELETLLSFSKYQPLMEQLAHVLTSYPYISEPQDEVARQMKEIADRRVFGSSKLNQFIDQIMRDYIHVKECLIHGDYSTRNMLVKGDDVKMVDHEFVRLGPLCSESGRMFADMLLAYYYHLVSPEDADSHRQIAHKIRDCTHHFVNTYIEHMSWSKGEEGQRVTEFLKEFAGHAGMMLFIIICFGGSTFLGASQIHVFEASIRLMEQHHEVDSVDKIYTILALE